MTGEFKPIAQQDTLEATRNKVDLIYGKLGAETDPSTWDTAMARLLRIINNIGQANPNTGDLSTVMNGLKKISDAIGSNISINSNPTYPFFRKRHSAITGLPQRSGVIRMGGRVIVAKNGYNKLIIYDPSTGDISESSAIPDTGFVFEGQSLIRIDQDRALFFGTKIRNEWDGGQTNSYHLLYLYEFALSTRAIRRVFQLTTSEVFNNNPASTAWIAYSSSEIRIGWSNSQHWITSSMSPITFNTTPQTGQVNRWGPVFIYNGVGDLFMLGAPGGAMYKRYTGAFATETGLATSPISANSAWSVSWIGNGKILFITDTGRFAIYDVAANTWSAAFTMNSKPYGQGDWNGQTLLIPTNDGYLSEFTLEALPEQANWWR